MDVRPETELNAFTNLVVAAAVNKRLLMRILAHLENKDLEEIHEEVAALDREFRRSVQGELADGRQPELGEEEPVVEGAIPVGREEERRGHALANDASTPSSLLDAPLGKDQSTRASDRVSQEPPRR